MSYFRAIGFALFLFFLICEAIYSTRNDLMGFELIILSNAQHQNENSFVELSFFGILKWIILRFDTIFITLPLFSSVTVDVICFAQVHFCESSVNLVPADPKFNNIRAMLKLPFVGHVVTSPSVLEGDDNFKVGYLSIGSTGFFN
jgi:hypothetical protein